MLSHLYTVGKCSQGIAFTRPQRGPWSNSQATSSFLSHPHSHITSPEKVPSCFLVSCSFQLPKADRVISGLIPRVGNLLWPQPAAQRGQTPQRDDIHNDSPSIPHLLQTTRLTPSACKEQVWEAQKACRALSPEPGGSGCRKVSKSKGVFSGFRAV